MSTNKVAVYVKSTKFIPECAALLGVTRQEVSDFFAFAKLEENVPVFLVYERGRLTWMDGNTEEKILESFKWMQDHKIELIRESLELTEEITINFNDI